MCFVDGSNDEPRARAIALCRRMCHLWSNSGASILQGGQAAVAVVGLVMMHIIVQVALDS